jgi:hypothetical protein
VLLSREAAHAQQQGRAMRLRLMGVRVSKLERADGSEGGLASAGQLTLEAAFTRAQATHRAHARDAPGCDNAGGIDVEHDGVDSWDDSASEREHSHHEEEEEGGDGSSSAAERASRCLRSPLAEQPRPHAEQPRRLSKYARLDFSEVDPTVLSELPEHLRAEIGAEIEHECARRRTATQPAVPAQLERSARVPATNASRQPRGGHGGLRSPNHPAAWQGGIKAFLAAGPRAPGACDCVPSAGRLQAIRAIVSMGFGEVETAAALSASHDDVQRALDRLLEG